MSYGTVVLGAIQIGNGDNKVQEFLVVDVTLLDLVLETIGEMINMLISINVTILT